MKRRLTKTKGPAEMVYYHRTKPGLRIVVTKPAHSYYMAKFPDGTSRSFTQAELANEYKFNKKESRMVRFGGVLDSTRDLRKEKEMREAAKASYERMIF